MRVNTKRYFRGYGDAELDTLVLAEVGNNSGIAGALETLKYLPVSNFFTKARNPWDVVAAYEKWMNDNDKAFNSDAKLILYRQANDVKSAPVVNVPGPTTSVPGVSPVGAAAQAAFPTIGTGSGIKPLSDKVILPSTVADSSPAMVSMPNLRSLTRTLLRDVPVTATAIMPLQKVSPDVAADVHNGKPVADTSGWETGPGDRQIIDGRGLDTGTTKHEDTAAPATLWEKIKTIPTTTGGKIGIGVAVLVLVGSVYGVSRKRKLKG